MVSRSWRGARRWVKRSSKYIRFLKRETVKYDRRTGKAELEGRRIRGIRPSNRDIA